MKDSGIKYFQEGQERGNEFYKVEEIEGKNYYLLRDYYLLGIIVGGGYILVDLIFKVIL